MNKNIIYKPLYAMEGMGFVHMSGSHGFKQLFPKIGVTIQWMREIEVDGSEDLNPSLAFRGLYFDRFRLELSFNYEAQRSDSKIKSFIY